ncbi:MAG: TRAP transporter large permease subunit, partial [Pseudomonadota bacterium]|nr:TRAP transporter large permease subunit [Pseudomonadota bacterium]
MTVAVFLLLLLGAVPIALVLALTAMWYIQASGNTVLFDSYPQQLFSAIESYGLLAIPLFMLAGELMNEGGLTKRLIALARILVGGFRGGLAYINLVANMMMAAIIGSAASQIAIMSRAMVPAMEEEGYDTPYSAAITAAGGLLSPIIPPSMLFVLFGVMAQVPIAEMFIAGLLPGLLLGASFFVVIALVGLVQQYPKGQWPSRQQALHDALWGMPALLIPVIIIGGILLGIATPTESAALASLAALLMGRFVYGDLRFQQLPQVLTRTA